jgi:outer membrane protein TolC
MVVVILVSMGVGAAAVAAAYEAQNSQLRERLESTYEQRAELARQRLALATQEHERAQRRFEVGLSDATTVMERGTILAQAQAQLDLVELDLQEIRLAGREPRHELSAPRVSGRDFVTERLRIEQSVPERVLATERALAVDIQRRVEIGTSRGVELETSRSRVLELDVAVDTLRRKLDIRQRFVSGKMDAVETELRVLEAEAEQVTRALGPQIELAKQEVARLTARVTVGLATQFDVMAAAVRRLELETTLGKAELDLALIRRRIDEHRKQ